MLVKIVTAECWLKGKEEKATQRWQSQKVREKALTMGILFVIWFTISSELLTFAHHLFVDWWRAWLLLLQQAFTALAFVVVDRLTAFVVFGKKLACGVFPVLLAACCCG